MRFLALTLTLALALALTLALTWPCPRHPIGQHRVDVERALVVGDGAREHEAHLLGAQRPRALAAAVPPAGSPRASRPRATVSLAPSGAVGANPTIHVLATTTTAVVRQPWRGMPGCMGSMGVSGGMGGMGGVVDSSTAVEPPSQLRRARTRSHGFRRDVPTKRWCEPAPVRLVVTAARLAASLVERP